MKMKRIIVRDRFGRHNWVLVGPMDCSGWIAWRQRR